MSRLFQEGELYDSTKATLIASRSTKGGRLYGEELPDDYPGEDRLCLSHKGKLFKQYIGLRQVDMGTGLHTPDVITPVSRFDAELWFNKNKDVELHNEDAFAVRDDETEAMPGQIMIPLRLPIRLRDQLTAAAAARKISRNALLIEFAEQGLADLS